MDDDERIRMTHLGEQATAGMKEVAVAIAGYYRELVERGVPEERAFGLAVSAQTVLFSNIKTSGDEG